ncbi:MAG TPA: transposase family protein [Bacillus sp. (in: firmicutes)]|nr:transposase family protein [Bacillus sp. (in: firmicutes)]
MKGHGEKLTRNMEKAVIALLNESTVKKAAEKAGISESTLYRWQQLPQFQELFNQMKAQSVSNATARLRNAMSLAVTTLEDVMRAERAPAMAKVIAAKSVLELGLDAVKTEEIQERMKQLEELLEEQQKEGRFG